jgi:hypothetical protein
MGRYGVSPFEGVTENAERRLQAGEGVPLQQNFIDGENT